MPEIILFDHNQPLPKLGGLFKGGFLALLADGSVRFLSNSTPLLTLQALSTCAGGEVVPGDF